MVQRVGLSRACGWTREMVESPTTMVQAYTRAFLPGETIVHATTYKRALQGDRAWQLIKEGNDLEDGEKCLLARVQMFYRLALPSSDTSGVLRVAIVQTWEPTSTIDEDEFWSLRMNCDDNGILVQPPLEARLLDDLECKLVVAWNQLSTNVVSFMREHKVSGGILE